MVIYSYKVCMDKKGAVNTMTFEGLLGTGSELKLMLCDQNHQEKIGCYYIIGPRKNMFAMLLIHRSFYGYSPAQILS